MVFERSTSVPGENPSKGVSPLHFCSKAMQEPTASSADALSGDPLPPVGDSGHTVKDNECTSSIADEHGFFWETLWDHPKNEALRAARLDPNALLPGDRLFIPELTERTLNLPVERCHRFRRRGVPEKLRLRFAEADGQPRAAQPYVLDLGYETQCGETDAEGTIEIWIRPATRRATLLFLDPTTRGCVGRQELELGRMPPVDSTEGVAARLSNLGLWSADLEVREALSVFQEQVGLEATGVFDASTRAKLVLESGG